MSYSDFNNAYFDMNHKLLETFDGVYSEDINYNKNNEQTNNLNGTSINDLNTTPTKNLNNTLNNNNLKNDKLTHRECINLYFNPDYLKNPKNDIVFKHLTKCTLCQNEINKKINQYNNLNLNNNNLSNTNPKTENKNIILSISELELLLKNILNNERNYYQNYNEINNFNKIFKLLEEKNLEKKPLSIEINFINIIICLLIILLIIDIILRLKK
jgi:hypothetical protein